MADILIDDAVLGAQFAGRAFKYKLGEAPSVKDFGAIGNGVADDSTAVQAALASAVPVFVPPGSYLIGDVVPSPRSGLYGFASTTYGHTTSAPALPLPMLIAKSGATRLFNMSGVSQFSLRGLSLYGNVTRSVQGIAGGSNVTIDDCRFFFFSQGIGAIGGDYPNLYTVTCSTFRDNTIGIRNPNDSFISNCIFADNVSEGMSGGAGHGSLNIDGCVFEWNGGCGLFLNDGARVVLGANRFDRNGLNGLKLVRMTGVDHAVGHYSRNGASGSAVPGESAHLWLEDLENCNILGVSTSHGADDGGGGTDSPAYGLYTLGTMVNTSVQGNFSGAVTGSRLSGGTTRTSYREITELLSFHEQFGWHFNPAPVNATLAAGASTVITMRCAAIGANDALPIMLHVVARRASGGTGRNYTAFRGVRLREGAGAGITWGTGERVVASMIDTAIPGVTSTIRVSVGNVATDGSSFDVTLLNSDVTDSYVVKAWATPA